MAGNGVGLILHFYSFIILKKKKKRRRRCLDALFSLKQMASRPLNYTLICLNLAIFLLHENLNISMWKKARIPSQNDLLPDSTVHKLISFKT